jgi:hypothetical protein
MVIVANQHLVSASGNEGLSLIFDILTEEDGNNFLVESVGQLAGFT